MNTQQRQSEPRRGSPRGRTLVRTACGCAADLLFPPICALCASPMPTVEPRVTGIRLCGRCLGELTASGTPACRLCARPLPKGAPAESSVCPHCRGRRVRFARTYALGVYGGLLREAVLQMKRSTGETLTLAMGRLLARHLTQNIDSVPSHLVAVPTHWTRRLGRTVNCAEILLESVAASLSVRSCPKLLRCRRKTNKQGTLLPNERRVNVRGAYRVSAGYAMNGANVLLIDDVMTTGATANEIAKILRQAGAARIEVAVVARGIGFDG